MLWFFDSRVGRKFTGHPDLAWQFELKFTRLPCPLIFHYLVIRRKWWRNKKANPIS